MVAATSSLLGYHNLQVGLSEWQLFQPNTLGYFYPPFFAVHYPERLTILLFVIA